MLTNNKIKKVLLFFLLVSVILLQSQVIVRAGIFKKHSIDIQDRGNYLVTQDQKTWLLPQDILNLPDLNQQDLSFPDFKEIKASQYIVMDLKTGDVLLEKGINETAYPASMTKILTALTIIEAEDFDPERSVVFSEAALDMPSPLSVTGGFSLGEETTSQNALYLMMVKSANDCAKALAETYGGNEENFAQMMNAKAAELGCSHTNVTEAAGFGLDDHYISPYDLALITKRAMEHDIFRNMVAKKTYYAEATSLQKTSAWSVSNNTNLLLLDGDGSLSSPYLHTYDGVKTGTTDLAGYCLAASVHTYDGKHLLGIIFNGDIMLESGKTHIGILLRGILEKAAIDSGSPSREEAILYLEANQSVVKDIQKIRAEQLVIPLETESMQIVHTEERASESQNETGRVKTSQTKAIQANSQNPSLASEESSQLHNIDFNVLIPILLTILLVFLIVFLLIKIIKNLKVKS